MAMTTMRTMTTAMALATMCTPMAIITITITATRTRATPTHLLSPLPPLPPRRRAAVVAVALPRR